LVKGGSAGLQAAKNAISQQTEKQIANHAMKSAGQELTTEVTQSAAQQSEKQLTQQSIKESERQLTSPSKGLSLKKIKAKHDAAADKLASELNKLGNKARHAGNETIKDVSGKSIKGTRGTATTRKPDVVVETDAGDLYTGIEVKTSADPATVKKATDQLANEASFEGSGRMNGKQWTVGQGTGVVYVPYGELQIMPANLMKN
jgi:DnaJ-domain-containing protein 1